LQLLTILLSCVGDGAAAPVVVVALELDVVELVGPIVGVAVIVVESESESPEFPPASSRVCVRDTQYR
jgi:hypothetical protein